MLCAHAQIARLRRLIGAVTRTLCQRQDVRNSGISVSPRHPLRVVAIARGPHTKAALRTIALHEDWHLLLAFSSEDARKLLGRFAVDILVYDYDSGGGNWRKLCSDCVDRGVGFQLVASVLSDDLFLESIAAGGLGVLWKPVTSEKMISAMRLARNFAEEQLPRAGNAHIHLGK
jgi:hypothetical protein